MLGAACRSSWPSRIRSRTDQVGGALASPHRVECCVRGRTRPAIRPAGLTAPPTTSDLTGLAASPAAWKRFADRFGRGDLVWFLIHDELVAHVADHLVELVTAEVERCMRVDFMGVPISSCAVPLFEPDGHSRWGPADGPTRTPRSGPQRPRREETVDDDHGMDGQRRGGPIPRRHLRRPTTGWCAGGSVIRYRIRGIDEVRS